jgi:spore coat protein U-like protein
VKIWAACLATALLIPGSVLGACIPRLSVSATALDFGVYDPGSSMATKSNATVTLQCLVGLLPSFTVALSPGGSGNYSQRAMSQGGNALLYNIYVDPNGTMVWGDGSGATSTKSFSGLLSLGATNFTAYGIAPKGQYVAPGNFSDTITVTVTY